MINAEFSMTATLVGATGVKPSTIRLSDDLSPWAQGAVLLLVVVTLVLLFLEVRALRKQRALVFGSGLLAVLALALAVLRPSRLETRGHEVPGLVTVLVDASHRLSLPAESSKVTRAAHADSSTKELQKLFAKSRVEVRSFDDELLAQGHRGTTSSSVSDLTGALRRVATSEGERPQSIVVLSDGRLSKPGAVGGEDWKRQVKNTTGGIVVHTVGLTNHLPRDRSIREIGFTGSAVAHQPITLELTVGCHPENTCAAVEVVVRELLEGQAPVELTRGKTEGDQGSAKLDLQFTLERAGGRVIEVELLGEKDEIPENNRRVLPVQVRRDRLRMLHVAGRPTYDVRALRMFLKADQSIDLVSFFILRTPDDEVGARPDELALIPFPVDELFSEHLDSFDAVILQDIDAPRYGLDRYFPALERYVREGGGLILVGGPTGFSSGGYAGTAVGDVLPVELPSQGDLVTRRPFVPTYTEAGRTAPLLAPLRASMGEELPEMSGANILGRALPGSVVLWEHPTLFEAGASGGAPMPVLALGEVGDGRTIAISVDSTHQLRFGGGGATAGGRAHADLWGGLLGWLMRDPRFEGTQVRLIGDCVAGKDQTILVEPAPPPGTKIEVSTSRLGVLGDKPLILRPLDPAKDAAARYLVERPAEGGYAARVKLGDAPPTRAVFACEAGGPAWADSRPDVGRLREISEATGGVHVARDALSDVPEPEGTFVAARRVSTPFLPPWLWGVIAAFFMSAHWLLRRAVGYA